MSSGKIKEKMNDGINLILTFESILNWIAQADQGMDVQCKTFSKSIFVFCI